MVARSTNEACWLVKVNGMPSKMSLDHDLGGDDTTMVFLSWLAYEHWNGTEALPEYVVHSANPIGTQNISSFMESWRRSREL